MLKFSAIIALMLPLLVGGEKMFAQPQRRASCSVPGHWTTSFGKITINPDLSGTFVAPYCSHPFGVSVRLQGGNAFTARFKWEGDASCQSFTESMAFTTTDCNTAQGTYLNDAGDGTRGSDVWSRSVPQLSLSRPNLTAVETQGMPAGGAFSYTAKKLSGGSVAGIKFAPGVSAADNPNMINLINPNNPSAIKAPSQGGLVQITDKYTTPHDGKTSKTFSVPTFGVSCYYTTLEADWGTPPAACSSITIRGRRYAGTITNPLGFAGTYCSSFIAELKLQGAAYTNDNRILQRPGERSNFRGKRDPRCRWQPANRRPNGGKGPCGDSQGWCFRRYRRGGEWTHRQRYRRCHQEIPH